MRLSTFSLCQKRKLLRSPEGVLTSKTFALWRKSSCGTRVPQRKSLPSRPARGVGYQDGIEDLFGGDGTRLVMDGLLRSAGPLRQLASEKHIVTPALDHIIEANTLLSGIGFESAGLAAAHSIHNGLTTLAETHSFYHGEKVAFGVLSGLQLTDTSVDESATVFSFCEDWNLPIAPWGWLPSGHRCANRRQAAP